MDIIKKKFETSDLELRLVDNVSFFYAFEVIAFTGGDFKSNYPIWITLLGILFHILAYLVASDQWRMNPRISSIDTKNVVYKTLPFGLIVTYSLSLSHGITIGELNILAIDNIIRFLFTAIPMIIYFFYLGFSTAQKQKFGILGIRNRLANIGYSAIYIILFILGQYLK